MQDSLFSQRPQQPQPQQPQPLAMTVRGVSEVLSYVRRLIAANKALAATRIRGEVSGLNPSNGHLRFNLAEGKDSISCIVWSSDAPKFSSLRDGDQVICGGDFSVYQQRGIFQLIVREIEYTGSGAIYAQLKALEEKLRKEGLFDTSRKRPMPVFPQRIAIVSSRTSRGMDDFLTTMARRAAFVEIKFVETRVQGDGAEMDIAEAIDKASKMNVDVIVLTRGGGSVEDLFPFNKEPVARAIARAKHPVMTAIGHNLDMHVSDQVADYHCETPSNAAQYFGEIGDRYRGLIERYAVRLDRRVREIKLEADQRFGSAATALRHASQIYASRKHARLVDLERRLQRNTPSEGLNRRRERLANLRSRLDVLARSGTRTGTDRLAWLNEALSRQRSAVLRGPSQRLGLLTGTLTALNPTRILERGYAIVTLNGKALRNASDAPAGTEIEATLEHGKLRARVEGAASDG
ncbi:MAG TPA: exodeoxyribonuclease VII large subunit [Candidatus Baltobacteraceae bacterium]|nr:exodeoxyribonuclease VII large subunit [Candidatus Baltobacteraceae bacterium]